MNRWSKFAALMLLTVAAGAVAVNAEVPTTQIAASWRRPRITGTPSDSGHFSLDESKLRALFPNSDWTADQILYLAEHLDRGDSRAAIVASVRPLVVSAYSDELDAVILIQFPDALVDQYHLAVGDQLIASWIYPRLKNPASDIVPGPRKSKRNFNDGAPLAADFFSDSVDKLKRRKERVSKAEWDRVNELTPEAMKRANGRYRSCFPLATGYPPDYFDAPADGAK